MTNASSCLYAVGCALQLPFPALAQVRSDLKVSLLLAGGNDAGTSTGTEGSWVSHQVSTC